MGFFSYKTCDTQKSIANHYSTRATFTVHLITEDGQIFTEKDYDGYGEFGGKDIFSLIAQMNGFVGSEDDAREHFFTNILKSGFIGPDGKEYLYRRDFENYESKMPQFYEKTPNELIAEGCEKIDTDYTVLAKLAAAGYKTPKIVEKLPTKENWATEWAALPYPEDCEFQGFFYPEHEEEEEGW